MLPRTRPGPAPGPRADRPPLPAWLALLAVAVATLQQWALPAFLGEDEPWHLEYAEHVADGHRPAARPAPDPELLHSLSVSQVQIAARFPSAPHAAVRARQVELLAALDEARVWERVDWTEDPSGATSFDALHPGITAAAQPPGYYLLAGAWLRLCPFDGVLARLRWVRLLSAASYVALVWLTWAVARELGGPAPPSAAAALVALMPMHARHAATANPDAVAKLFVAVATLAALRYLADRRRRWVALACAAALLAPWFKSTAVTGAVPAGAVALLALRARLGVRRALALALVAAGALVGLFVALGSSPVVPANAARALERARGALAPESLHEFGRTLVGAFGWYGRSLPDWFGVVAAGAALVAALGLLRAWPGRGADGADSADSADSADDAAPARAALALLALVVAAQLGAIVLRGEAVGRYLYPALPAAAALAVHGWWTAFRGRLRPLAAPSLAFFLALWFGLALLSGAVLDERLALGS